MPAMPCGREDAPSASLFSLGLSWSLKVMLDPPPGLPHLRLDLSKAMRQCKREKPLFGQIHNIIVHRTPQYPYYYCALTTAFSSAFAPLFAFASPAFYPVEFPPTPRLFLCISILFYLSTSNQHGALTAPFKPMALLSRHIEAPATIHTFNRQFDLGHCRAQGCSPEPRPRLPRNIADTFGMF